MPIVKIVVSADKGGVGKTSIAANLAATIVRSGKSVLLIDLDTQADLTTAVGLRQSTYMAELLRGTRRIQQSMVEVPEVFWAEPEDKSVPRNGQKLLCVPGGGMAGLSEEVAKWPADYLNKILAPLSSVPGGLYVVVDTAPTSGPLMRLAFGSADWVLTPVEPEPSSVDNAIAFYDRIGKTAIKEKMLGFMVNRVEKNWRGYPPIVEEYLGVLTAHPEFITMLTRNMAWVKARGLQRSIFTAYTVERNTGKTKVTSDILEARTQWSEACSAVFQRIASRIEERNLV